MTGDVFYNLDLPIGARQWRTFTIVGAPATILHQWPQMNADIEPTLLILTLGGNISNSI